MSESNGTSKNPEEQKREEIVALVLEELQQEKLMETLFNKVKLAAACEKAAVTLINESMPREIERVKQAVGTDLFQAMVKRAFAKAYPEEYKNTPKA